MTDQNKTKAQLISELAHLQQKITELESTKGKFQALFENLPVGIFQSTPSGKYRLVNSTFAKMNGYSSPEEMINSIEDISTLYADPAERENVKRMFAETGQLNGHIIRHIRADGQTRWMSIFGKCVYDDADEIIYYDGFTIDVTERKQAEEKLKRSAAALEKAQQVAHLGSWEWHIKTNRLEWSDEMYHIFGIDKETFSGDLSEVTSHAIHPDDRAKVEQSNMGVVNDKRPDRLEYRVIWPDGSVHVVWAEAGELILDEAGNPTVLTGIAQDITQRKRDQEILRESEERFKAIFLQSPIAIEIFDANGLLLDANKKCLDMFGVSQIEHVKGFNLFDDPNIPVTEIEKLKKGYQISFTSEFDFEIVKKKHLYPTSKSGKMFWEVSAKALLDENGSIVGYLVQVQDITARKQAEKSLQASENQFRRAVTESPVPIMIHDDADNILQLSKGWTDYSGYTLEDIPTLAAWTEKAYGSASGSEKEYIDKLFEVNETVDNGEWTVTAKDGSKRFWEFKTTPLSKNANGKRILHSMAIDITERKELDALQKKLTERIEAGLRAGNISWWELELPSRNIIFDKRKAEMLGYAPELFTTYEDFTNLLHPDDYEQAMHAMRDHLQGTADTYEVEYRLKTITGDYLWFRDIGRITEFDDTTGLTRIVGIVEDIHVRKQSQKAVEESEALYKSVVSALNEGLVVQNTADQIIMSNNSAAQILGLTTQQLIGKDSYDPRWQALLEDGSPLNPEDHPSMITLRTGKPVHNFIMEIHTGDNNRSFISINSQPVFNAKKEVTGAVVSFTDITRQKHAERAQKQLTQRLEQQAHQLQMVMDSVPEGVFVIDSNGIILLTNPKARQDLMALAGGSDVGDRLQQLGENPLAELLAPPPTGLWHQIAWQNRTYELIAKPLQGSETETGWVVVIRDITTEKEVEKRIQQQEQLASVGQLAAGIAHDFNNIMGVITLYAELTLADPKLPAVLQRRFETINNQSKYAVALIRQILDFARRSTMERLPMNLIPFLSELVKLFERTLPEDIDIRLHFDDTDLIINGDPTRLQQALMNLVVNARDAMPEGGVLTIDLERVPIDQIGKGLLVELKHQFMQKQNPENWVRLTVQDTGSGIPADILPHIFEPFYTTKEAGKGTGLGLAQVFGIIKQHEGEIDVTSKDGEGSTFIIYLPLLENENSEDTMPKPEPFLRGQGETILVVEDSISLQQVLIDSLKQLNYRAQIAKNGLEALHILKEHTDEIALVLTDLVMPEMGGKALIQEMKQAGLSTKIIVMTGHPLTNETEAIMALGVEGWLDKPLSLEKLGQAIWNALLQ